MVMDDFFFLCLMIQTVEFSAERRGEGGEVE